MSFLERCTEGAKRALALAQEAARAMGHNYVGSEHLLLGLIREGEGGAYRALSAFGVTEEAVAERADALVGRGDYHFTDSFGYTPRTKKILALSLYEAKSLKMGYIGTILKGMFGLNHNGFAGYEAMTVLKSNILFIAVAIIAVTPLVRNLRKYIEKQAKYSKKAMRMKGVLFTAMPVLLVLLSVLSLVGNAYNPFLYFQF